MGESEEKAKIVQCWEGGKKNISCSCNAAVQLGSRLSVVSEAFRIKLHFDILEENSFEYIVRPSPPCTSNIKQRFKKNSSFSSMVNMPSSCGSKRNSVFQVDFYGLNGDVLACGLSRGKPGRKICLTGKAA